jgi:hypothetical protein
MNMPTRYAVLLAAVACALSAGVSGAATEQEGFARYQVILDRSPFGAPVGPGSASEAPPPFSTRYAFVGVVKTASSGALLAIIQDRERNRPYFVAEGETIPNESVKLVRIEHSPSKIVLQQGLEVATLAYQPAGAGVASAPSGVPQPAQPSAPVLGRRRIPFMRGGG